MSRARPLAIAIHSAGERLLSAVYIENTGLAQYRGGRFSVAASHLERAIEIYRDTATELRTAAEEQIKITRLRLGKLLGES